MADPQATSGSRYQRDVTGLRSIDLLYIIDGPAEDGGPEPWDILDNFTPEAPLGLAYAHRNAVKQTDGTWHLTVTFEGITEEAAVGAVLEYDNSSVEDPIESFDQFDLIATKYQAKLDPDTGNLLGWEPKITIGGQSVTNPLRGTTHFLNNQPVLRVIYCIKEFPKSVLQNICKVEVPQVPTGTADNVQTPDGKSWVKRSVRAEQRGNVWRIIVEYLLGKWVPEIYNPRN